MAGLADPNGACGTALLRRRDHQILGPDGYPAQLADGLCRDSDVVIRLDMHRIGQTAERDLQRYDAFGLVSLGVPSTLPGVRLPVAAFLFKSPFGQTGAVGSSLTVTRLKA